MLSLFPIAVMQDRHRGKYSGGAWLAISRSEERTVGDAAGTAEAAAAFWSDPPEWIAAGPTPDLAVEALVRKTLSAVADGVSLDDLRQSCWWLNMVRIDPNRYRAGHPAEVRNEAAIAAMRENFGTAVHPDQSCCCEGASLYPMWMLW